jgi:hypothetical protein
VRKTLNRLDSVQCSRSPRWRRAPGGRQWSVSGPGDQMDREYKLAAVETLEFLLMGGGLFIT